MIELQKLVFNYPKTKAEQLDISTLMIEEILGGSFDPLEAFIAVKAFGNVLATALKDSAVQSAALDEISKYEKDQRIFGVRVGKGATGNTYDFSNSPEYVGLAKEIKFKEERLKGIKKVLVASYHASIKIASMEDGAELKIKMTQAGRETIKITFSEK